jgi:hypothetical protein
MQQIEDLGEVLPGSEFFILARLWNLAGKWAKPGDLSAINLRVDNETLGTNVAAVAVDVATVLSDLTVDGRWKKDKIGYNFAFPVVASQIAAAATSYLFKFQLIAGVGDDAKSTYAYFRVKTLKPQFALPA